MKKLIKVIELIIIVISISVFIFNAVFILDAFINPDETPKILGKQVYIVNSGSSQTNIKYKELVLVDKTENIEVGDVVAVATGDKKATTYSVKKVNSNVLKLEDTTKDEVQLTKNSIEGKVCYKSLFWGNVVFLLRNPIVITLCMILTSLLSLCVFRMNLMEEKENDDKKS